jgi:hypothetical protein
MGKGQEVLRTFLAVQLDDAESEPIGKGRHLARRAIDEQTDRFRCGRERRDDLRGNTRVDSPR